MAFGQIRTSKAKYKTPENIFKNEKYTDKWFVFSPGRHFQGVKIFHVKEMIEIQDKMIKRNPNKDYSCIKLKNTDAIIFDFSNNYVGPFDSLFRAKEYIVNRKLKFIRENIRKLQNILNDEIIIERYKLISGYNKTKRAKERLKEKYPEYFI